MSPEDKFYFRALEIIRGLKYKPNTGFSLYSKQGGLLFLGHWQVVQSTDDDSAVVEPMFGRKFYLSPHMTDEEIVRTARLAVLTFEEHEANEWLTYLGSRVLNPHPEGPRPDTRATSGNPDSDALHVAG